MKGAFLFGAALALVALAGCTRQPSCRVEWPVMGTVASLVRRGGEPELAAARDRAREVFAEVSKSLNAHDPESELNRLAPLDEAEILSRCAARMRACYAAAFALGRASGGAFAPRWQGARHLDLGAIAKGFAVDLAAESRSGSGEMLLDLGGNLKSVAGSWRTGVKDPDGGAEPVAEVELRAGEALATSATYYRGRHIYDGRTLCPVTNGVKSVTVLHPTSAMMADGLSTTLFVLGPREGREFLSRHAPEASALWIMEGGGKSVFGSRFGVCPH